jgi:hypothetical protein
MKKMRAQRATCAGYKCLPGGVITSGYKLCNTVFTRGRNQSTKPVRSISDHESYDVHSLDMRRANRNI